MALRKSFFLNRRNQKICGYYWKKWEKPRALLLLSHGYTEHSMLYEPLALEMSGRGFYVFAHDHAGHGHSEGQRAFVEDIHHLVDESLVHIKMVRDEYPDLPLFICGHSMGGAVSVLLSLETDVSGMVLIAPALASNPETATFFKVTMGKLISKFLPNFPLASADFNLCSRDPKKVNAMYQDPLRYCGVWKARPIVALLQAGEEIANKRCEVVAPFFLLHGDSDKICHIDGSRKLYEEAKSKDKTFKVYEGGYHSLLNEPDDLANDAFQRIVTWLEKKISI